MRACSDALPVRGLALPAYSVALSLLVFRTIHTQRVYKMTMPSRATTVPDMTGVSTKTQFGIEPPAAGRRTIETRPSGRDVTKGGLGDGRDTDNEYDMEDFTESIMEGLRGVYAYQRGEIHLPTFDEFVKELEDEKTRGAPVACHAAGDT